MIDLDSKKDCDLSSKYLPAHIQPLRDRSTRQIDGAAVFLSSQDSRCLKIWTKGSRLTHNPEDGSKVTLSPSFIGDTAQFSFRGTDNNMDITEPPQPFMKYRSYAYKAGPPEFGAQLVSRSQDWSGLVQTQLESLREQAKVKMGTEIDFYLKGVEISCMASARGVGEQIYLKRGQEDQQWGDSFTQDMMESLSQTAPWKTTWKGFITCWDFRALPSTASKDECHSYEMLTPSTDELLALTQVASGRF
ncbi:uncharacterized protein I303_100450 [Kwoniella dejecticola CBS 10117]|uniref:Uncharacterized protein n=1 Tax=Kwoniella dejecticola CBS 10117 TaxID=1296121 RepID=A0A1A6AF29_9TREE|nr:uncharacterized protein I303_00450 [Kwoniella dejecticola CBS 10117]OBR88633.1 hypothetical protein I303_00450 [Kwoniella dejecticola CBS 10117]